MRSDQPSKGLGRGVPGRGPEVGMSLAISTLEREDCGYSLVKDGESDAG